jgi:hypothetical protein
MSSPRRRRRRQSEIVAQRTLTDIRQRKLAFLRDVSTLLTDALGFTVKVSLVKPDRLAGMPPNMKRAARMTKKQARQQMLDAYAPHIDREGDDV